MVEFTSWTMAIKHYFHSIGKGQKDYFFEYELENQYDAIDQITKIYFKVFPDKTVISSANRHSILKRESRWEAGTIIWNRLVDRG